LYNTPKGNCSRKKRLNRRNGQRDHEAQKHLHVQQYLVLILQDFLFGKIVALEHIGLLCLFRQATTIIPYLFVPMVALENEAA
ncbi:hypothetical protein N9Y89_02360, partial [bacterium]|nr:hypothetical protein [bacterium]